MLQRRHSLLENHNILVDEFHPLYLYLPMELNNQIYKQLKEMEETITKLRSQLKVEQDRYIAQFTTMENLINKMNNQSSYLSQITG